MFQRLLRTTLSISSLAVLCACGGGATGTNTETATPVQIGAALPEQGDYIAISQTKISLAESSRTGSIVVMRNGQAINDSSVRYRFVAGTATAGDDFSGQNGTLSWAAGERGEKTISFRVESDTVAESAENFYLELFESVGQDQLGINDRVNIDINDSPCKATIPATIASNTRLSEPCYRLGGIVAVSSSAQLDISAGTTIVASGGAGFRFSDTATLNSEGNSSLPVIIKSAGNQPGDWYGFHLESTSALHRIGHTEIANTTNAVALVSGGFAQFDNNLLANNSAAGVILSMFDVETLGTQNTFTNTPRGIELTGGTIDENQTVHLPVQSTHYVISKGLVNKGALELAAGTDLRMAADVPVVVLGTGSISAVGTIANPISITGLEAQQGFWNGIQYVSSSSLNNRFEHVTIAHGGGDPARAGNIIVDGLHTQIVFQQCAITHSGGFGINYDSSAFQVELDNVTFDQNRLGEQSL